MSALLDDDSPLSNNHMHTVKKSIKERAIWKYAW